MSTPPNDPGTEVRKQLISAIIWMVLAVAVAVILFVQAARPDNEKKTFYIIAGVFAVIAAFANGCAAWGFYQKSKTPPDA